MKDRCIINVSASVFENMIAWLYVWCMNSHMQVHALTITHIMFSEYLKHNHTHTLCTITRFPYSQFISLSLSYTKEGINSYLHWGSLEMVSFFWRQHSGMLSCPAQSLRLLTAGSYWHRTEWHSPAWKPVMMPCQGVTLTAPA